MSAINEVSELYAAYIKGWDAALLQAAFMLGDCDERDVLLALLKEAKEEA